jgi:hypothetical protein
MTYMEVIEYLVDNPKFFKGTFMSDGEKVVSKVNEDTIRVFVPREYREASVRVRSTTITDRWVG